MPGLDDQIAGAQAPRGSAEELASLAFVERRLFGRGGRRLTVSRYELESKLGAGAGGTVFVARDPRLDRPVAIKLIEPERVGEDRNRDRDQSIIAEAQALAQVSSPNVVQIYDAGRYELNLELGGVPGDGVFIVMELVDGSTLAHWLRAEPRPWTAVVQRFMDAGRGLAAAHRAGLLHRDFKPANVLVASDGSVKVTDFGLAKPDRSARLSSDSRTTMVDGWHGAQERTAPGLVLGTPRYMAPEQHLGRELTAAVDQYAFCVALWEALSGRSPFSGRRLLEQKLEGPPPWNDERTPRRIVRALRRGLSPDPTRRWSGMKELLQVLDGSAARRKKRVFLGGAVMGVLVASAFGLSLPTVAPTGEPCPAASPKSIWNPVVREQVERRLSANPHPDARVSVLPLMRRLDGFAEDWQERAQRACAAKALRGSTAEVDGRLDCLSRRLTELEGFVDLLRSGDEHWLGHALPEAYRLPWPSSCEAASSEASRGTREVELEGQLFAVETLWRAGRVEEARAQMEEIRTEAADLGDPALSAAIHVSQGRLDGSSRPRAAISSFEAGYHQAIASRRWYLAAEAAASLVALHSQGDATGADLRWRREAEAIIDGHEVGEIRGMLLTNVALADLEAGRYDEARERMHLALEVFGARPGVGVGGEIVNLSNLSVLEVRAGNPEAAEAHARAALQRAIEAYGPEHSATLGSRMNLGSILADAGRIREGREHLRVARTLAETALPATHPRRAALLSALTLAELKDGRASEALALADEALEVAEQAELSFTLRLPLLESRAIALAYLGRHEQAVAAYRSLAVQVEERLSAQDPRAVQLALNFVAILRRAGRIEEAEQAFHDAKAQLQAVGDPNGDSWARLLADGAWVSLHRNDNTTAVERAQRCVAASGATSGHPTGLLRHAILGQAWAAQGRAEGMLVMSAALAGLEAVHRPGHPVIADVHHTLGLAWLQRGEPAFAIHHLERALQIRDAEAVDPADRAATAEQLAVARAALVRASRP